MMIPLIRNELYRMFLSPLAWVILALTQIILAYLFLSHIEYFIQIQPQISAIPGAPGITELIVVPLLNNTAIILLLVSPLVTMRLIAEDRRNDNLPLLLSAPLSPYQIILGKYLATLIFFHILLSLISLMPLSLYMGSELDWGLLASGLMGLSLLLASFTAIGLFISSLTTQPSIAAMSTFTLLFLLWIIDWAGQSQIQTDSSNVLSWLSMLRHYEPMLRGEVNSNDIGYYLIITGLFLTLSIRQISSGRFR